MAFDYDMLQEHMDTTKQLLVTFQYSDTSFSSAVIRVASRQPAAALRTEVQAPSGTGP